MEGKKLSVVIPAYNEGEILKYTAKTLISILNDAKINFDIVFVNDGSKDNTWSVIEEISNKYKCVHGICFSRNFGKESAVFAGLNYAKGDCVAVMDADLQHPPETLVKMYQKWCDGYEVIEGVKASRGKESIVYKLGAKSFYKLISNATGVDMSTSSDFKLMDRKVVDSILSFPERHLFFRALSSWVGYKTAYVEFEVKERIGGESKWSFFSLIKYAIRNITTFSTAPMQLVSLAGIIFCILAVVIAVRAVYQYVMGIALGGFTTVILLVLILGAIVMLSLGIIGYYIAKIYEEVKKRPRYIVSQTVNEEK